MIRLDDGRTWKRHINQMRRIGENTPIRFKYDSNNTKYVDYNTEEQGIEESEAQNEVIERPVNIQLPDLRRSERVRSVPQRYGDYRTH